MLEPCPRCYRGTLLREGEDWYCINCAYCPTPAPLEFEVFPAQTDGRKQRRNTPRLKVAKEQA